MRSQTKTDFVFSAFLHYLPFLLSFILHSTGNSSFIIILPHTH